MLVIARGFALPPQRFHVTPSYTHSCDELQIIITLLSGSNPWGGVKGFHCSIHKKHGGVKIPARGSWHSPIMTGSVDSRDYQICCFTLSWLWHTDVKALILISFIQLHCVLLGSCCWAVIGVAVIKKVYFDFMYVRGAQRTRGPRITVNYSQWRKVTEYICSSWFHVNNC